MKGRLFVLSSPSGGGKTTVIKRLMERNPVLRYSVSATTRPPRKGEKDGEDYFFLDRENFRKKVEQKAFAEWAVVHDHYYGTLWSQIEKSLKEGKKILLDTDVQGGLNLKRRQPEAVLIFLLPPSMHVLEARLIQRGTESSEALAKRLQMAKKEIEMADKYDFLVINDRIENAVQEVQTIVQHYSQVK